MYYKLGENMVGKTKDKVVQVRVNDLQLEQFKQSCALLGVRPTVRIRELMNIDFVMVQIRGQAEVKKAE